ncbi:CRISPR-associated endonuclease Cas2 [Bifidobacterium angulatum]|uniref:CRISPR-associated endonuclease Cas2 n=1 Tax=Bifidobacterium angulatum TaxID=1683 RepID=UPI0005F8C954|nr:CRISPR-associated endonuclease Cas2 [Bifidobacterium angulatum]AMK58439.1 CRISPR-associated protein Cas2 [Bifidobacterium angulatum]
MRVVIFFDLPMKTAVERKAYTEFRKNLIKEGFLMIQESVYVRVATTRESARFLENRVASFVPGEGLVQSLIVTEKQYASIRFLLGKHVEDVRNADERTVII